MDGEALTLDPPLVFTSRPGALRVRLPRRRLRRSPAARTVQVLSGSTVAGLARVAAGGMPAVTGRPRIGFAGRVTAEAELRPDRQVIRSDRPGHLRVRGADRAAEQHVVELDQRPLGREGPAAHAAR